MWRGGDWVGLRLTEQHACVAAAPLPCKLAAAALAEDATAADTPPNHASCPVSSCPHVQGDIEKLASRSPEQLTQLFEQISGSDVLAKPYEVRASCAVPTGLC